jgi:hypothetical protein
LVLGKWIQQPTQKNPHIINAIIMMTILANENSIKNNLEVVINLFISNIKNEDLSESYVLAKSFRILLENNNLIQFRDKIENCLGSIMISLLSVLTNIHISPNVKDLNENFINVKSEIFKIYLCLFKSFQDKVFQFLLSRFELVSLLDRLTVVYLLKALLYRSELKIFKELLLNAVCKATVDNDFEYRYSLCEFIYVLFEKDIMTKEHSAKLIGYLIREAGITEDEIQSKRNSSDNYPFYTDLKTIKDKAEVVLVDLVTKVENSDIYLWPLILEFLAENNIRYHNSSLTICKIILQIKENVTNANRILTFDYKSANYLPLPNTILLRLFIILSSPLKRKDTVNNHIYINTLKVSNFLTNSLYYL